MTETYAYLDSTDLFQRKRQSGQELYSLLLEELKTLGPIRETKKSVSIALENRKPFASALIRDRSIKLILRLNRKISSPRIRNLEHVTGKYYDQTILIETKADIDEELIQWLGEAYQANK